MFLLIDTESSFRNELSASLLFVCTIEWHL